MLPFDWTFPYPSQRMPVMGGSMVATSQPLAAQAGLDVLRDGGNAFDAAIATAIAMTVLEPTSNGIGSDAFMLAWDGARLHGLNASGRAPRNLRRDRYPDDGPMPLRGWDPVTVPGAVSGWVAVHERFGRLPFARLFGPAIRYAREGFLVAPQTAGYWEAGVRQNRERAPFMATFAPDGTAPAAGTVARLPDHARTLEAIAESKGAAFYRGELAARIAADAKAHGHALDEADLDAHRADWVEPIAIDYRGWTLHEIPPNGQGIAALIALGILRHLPLGDLHPDCPESAHLQIEAMKLAFRDLHRFVADPAHMTVRVEALLDDAYLASRARLIDPGRAHDFAHGAPKAGGTILLCAADADGAMVSWIQSNYTGFGSGVVVPGTGISMQNRGACFVTEHGHPNEVGAGKRPFHTIIPGFLTKDGAPVMAFGVMGGPMQPQGHAQVVVRIVDHRQNPQAALDAPRWQVLEGMKVAIEPGFPAEVYERLAQLGHDLQIAESRTVRFGGGQAIWRTDGGYVGASDLRRDGQAVAR